MAVIRSSRRKTPLELQRKFFNFSLSPTTRRWNYAVAAKCFMRAEEKVPNGTLSGLYHFKSGDGCEKMRLDSEKHSYCLRLSSSSTWN